MISFEDTINKINATLTQDNSIPRLIEYLELIYCEFPDLEINSLLRFLPELKEIRISEYSDIKNLLYVGADFDESINVRKQVFATSANERLLATVSSASSVIGGLDVNNNTGDSCDSNGIGDTFDADGIEDSGVRDSFDDDSKVFVFDADGTTPAFNVDRIKVSFEITVESTVSDDS
ncbi:hypothetical protein ILUMI_05707 [Ignelater luminosus]|uniref:Uncharacterized protein n=1 Tax=Ignelater luminosus TaxID=2038154 RepID=A0A8K0GIF7_IGNLU|nr:hypothetical protein ILUMI_05707 [Ignelater luminosus]